MQAKRSKKKKKSTGIVNTHARTCTRASPSVSTRLECKQSARADLRSLLLLQLSRRKTSLAVSRPPPTPVPYRHIHAHLPNANKTVGDIGLGEGTAPGRRYSPLPQAPLKVFAFSWSRRGSAGNWEARQTPGANQDQH